MSRNGFAGILNSFKPNFYREIAFLPFTKSLKYLLFLILVIALILSVKFVFDLNTVANLFYKNSQEYLPDILSQIPEIKIEAGQVSSPVKQPYIFKKDDFSFILDTTGKINSLDSTKEGILLTKNKLSVKTAKDGGAETEINEYDLEKMRLHRLILKPGDMQKEELINLTWGDKEFSITPDWIKNFTFKITLFLFPVILLFNFLYFFVAKLFQVVFFSLASLVINATNGAKLKYSNLLNIGTYAITVPTLLSVVLLMFTGITNRAVMVFWPLAYIVIYIVFLSVAIMQCKDQETANPV